MSEKIVAIIHLLGHWSYLLIFLAAFLESAVFMGFIVPGETIVILSGFLASQGYLKLGECIWIISIGAVLGDTGGYIIGKTVGTSYFEKHKRLLFLKEKHLKKAREYFRRHGGEAVFFGRFIGFLRAIAPFIAGMSQMKYRKFAVYNVAGGVMWSVTFTLLGYFFGRSWQLIEKWSGRGGLFVLFMILIIAGFSYLYRTLVRRQAELLDWFRTRYSAFIAHSSVRKFIENHPRLVTFVKDRLSPENYLGLHLTIGLFISGLLIWLFGGITEDVLTSDPLVAVDQWVLAHVGAVGIPPDAVVIILRQAAQQVARVSSTGIDTVYVVTRLAQQGLAVRTATG